MTRCQRQAHGTKKNKLLRYQEVLNYYNAVKIEDVPVTVTYRKYIYPKFFISRRTLYEILSTPVVKELKEIQAIEDQQLSMF